MPRIGQNIYKRSDGRWEGRLKIGNRSGRTLYKSVYAKSCSDVKRKLDEVKLDSKSAEKNEINNQILFEDVVKNWLRNRSDELKPSTINRYEYLLEKYVYRFFAGKFLSEITTKDAEEMVSALSSEGGKTNNGLSSSTIQSIVSLLGSLGKYAVKCGYSENFRTDSFSLKHQRKDIRVFSEREERILIEELKRSPNLTSLGIMICLFTGIRVGELCALKWDKIDLREKTMKIDATMQRIRSKDSDKSKTKVIFGPPKSESSNRVIPLPDFLIRELKKYYTENAFVLTGLEDKYIEPRTMQYRFKKILARCQIPDANFHATRHTFATRCIELGFDAKSLSEILGHSSVTITLNKYVHPTMSHKAANMEKLSKYNLL